VPVSQHEVDELRRKGQALCLDAADCTLQTSAELLGYVIHDARSLGADQAETLDWVELIVRSTDMERETIREARDTLAALNYGPDLSKLLTKLARRAKPAPPRFRHQTDSALVQIERMRAERERAGAPADPVSRSTYSRVRWPL
jgi:hypothetical protein